MIRWIMTATRRSTLSNWKNPMTEEEQQIHEESSILRDLIATHLDSAMVGLSIALAARAKSFDSLGEPLAKREHVARAGRVVLSGLRHELMLISKGRGDCRGVLNEMNYIENELFNIVYDETQKEGGQYG